MAMRFRYLPHMADVAFVAYGRTFRQAVENSGEAILNIMFDIKKIKKYEGEKSEVNISATASSKEELVWKILQSIVSKLDETGSQAFAFRVTKLDEGKGSVKIKGTLKIVDTKKYMSLLEVKAVTPHGLEAKKEKGVWKIRVLLDV